MKSNDLIERYIYAATKNLPAKTKKDVADELKSIITDMLDERCGEVLSTDKDVRVVLTELGTPHELEDKYSSDSKKSLISGIYYTKYKLVLKIVLVCVIFGITLGIFIQTIMEQNVWHMALIQWIEAMFGSLITAFGLVTLIFVFLYHRGINIENFNIDLGNSSSSLDNLPPIPKRQSSPPLWETIAGITLSVVFVIIFLIVPQVMVFPFAESDTLIPVFNIDVLRSSWALIITFALLGIIRESVKLIDGKYTKRLMVVALVTDCISAVIACVWLLNDKLINPVLISVLNDTQNAFLSGIFLNIHYLFLGTIIFALLLDAITNIAFYIRNNVSYKDEI